MTVEAWLNIFTEVIDIPGYRHPAAVALAQFMQRYGTAIGWWEEGRRFGDQELAILSLRTGVPQRPVYPIKPVERIGILFIAGDAQPIVTLLRDDFPDTEHQQLMPEGFPAAICIDDRPWAEACLTWTPAELIDRILVWFRRAGRGELHDARQPLDPVLMRTELNFFIARSILTNGLDKDLIAEYAPDNKAILQVRQVDPARDRVALPFSLVTYQVAPDRMKRLRFAPNNLASLASLLEERGIALLRDLQQKLGAWLNEGISAAWRLNGRFAVLVEMPIVSPQGKLLDGIDQRAFVTAASAGDLAVALGIAHKSPANVGKVGYAKLIAPTPIDMNAIAAIEVQTAEVHLTFETDLAAQLAGRGRVDRRKAVLVGAGAIGSHVADCLMREGRFEWTVVDDDLLLPHNLARHVARGDQVTKSKAAILADHITATLSGAPASSIRANVLTSGTDAARVDTSLHKADLIIDATASLVAARHLSDHPAPGRRASVFFNPSGEAAVLLAEPANRSLTLRDLEAQYLGLLLRNEQLADHLGREPETVAYTGACRAITNRIPQSRAAILSGFAAAGLGTAVDGADGAITIWTVTPDGAVVQRGALETVSRFGASAWEIAIDAGLARRIHTLRCARLPRETGGVLFGLADIPAKRIHLVDASPAPPDSEETTSSFERGIVGVDELINSTRRRTAGQVRYVGEWHSHPLRCSTRPSLTDGRQIDWLAALMGMDSMPALMVIAGDHDMSVIFANRPAEPLPQPHAA